METSLTRLLHHPLAVLAMIIFISAVLILPMRTYSRIETDMDEYMPQSHPAFVYSDQAEQWFDIQDGIIIAIENPDGVYQSETLQKIKDLTKDLQEMDSIDDADVTSLYTAENILGSEYGLEVEPFYSKVPSSPEDLQELQQLVRSNDMAYGRIISTDETVALVIARIDDDAFTQSLYQEIRELTASYGGDETLYVAGRPIVEGSLAALAPADMAKMVPLVILVIIGVLLLVMRSFKATLLTLLVVLISVIWSFGLMAMLRIPIYAVSTMLPVMLIAIGVADGIHLFNHLRRYISEHPLAQKKQAIAAMISGMWKPVIITSVTTAIGFVSLVTSEVFPIKYFGLFTAFGVLTAMLCSLVLIPAGLMILGLPVWKTPVKKVQTHRQSTCSTSLSRWLLTHTALTIGLTAAITAVSLFGISQMWIDSSFLSQFEPDSEIVTADSFINSNFGGTSTLNVILEAEDPDTFKQPEVLELMLTMQQDVESSVELVGNSFSLSDYITRMHMVMHADDLAYQVIPDSQELIAQYLLLYEMSGDPDNLLEVVDYSYQKANMTFQLKDDSSLTINRAIDQIDTYDQQLHDLGIELNYAGSGYRSLVFSDLILEGQIASILISLVLVILLLSFMFKSILAGLIGALPIIITVFISFGVMGLMNIPLSTTTALLTSIAIGIGIDYAVHYIERYRIYSAETQDPVMSTILTMDHSGRAILFNALVVIAGFLVLLFSAFPPNRALGALVSLNMFSSFAGTLTIMALLLAKSRIYITKDTKKQELEDEQETFA
ncbi:MAG: MMPL family transporter [Spirochaetia bacterium]|nr:MMPL family transporter [Spirochaetia bacterium]